MYTLAECTSDLVLSKQEKLSGIIVHHAGVAVKVIFYMVVFLVLLKIILYKLMMSMAAECKFFNFQAYEELMLRSSSSKVVHHAGVAVRLEQVHVKYEKLINIKIQALVYNFFIMIRMVVNFKMKVLSCYIITKRRFMDYILFKIWYFKTECTLRYFVPIAKVMDD